MTKLESSFKTLREKPSMTNRVVLLVPVDYDYLK